MPECQRPIGLQSHPHILARLCRIPAGLFPVVEGEDPLCRLAHEGKLAPHEMREHRNERGLEAQAVVLGHLGDGERFGFQREAFLQFFTDHPPGPDSPENVELLKWGPEPPGEILRLFENRSDFG